MDKKVFLSLGLVYHAGKLLILLFEVQLIQRIVLSELVLVDAMGAECLRILLGVEERLIIGGPDEIPGYFGNRVRIDFSGFEILKPDGVDASSDLVRCEGQYLLIRGG